MAGSHERAELEFGSRCVLGGKSDISLNHRYFALIDDQHRNHFDADQKRVEVVCTVEQRIVLKTNSAASIKKRLEVLVVVMHFVLHRKDRLDEIAVPCGVPAFKLGDVGKIA